MTQAVVEICNRALAHIGQDEFITDINESSKAARLCRALFASTRDGLLRAHDWSFARTTQAMAEVAHKVTGWQHSYAYPDDCIIMRRVLPAEYARVQAIPAGSPASYCWPPNMIHYPLVGGQPVPYQLARHPDGGRIILTDMAEAVFEYTARVESPHEFPPDLQEVLALLLAAKLAMPMAVAPALAQSAAQAATQAHDRAAADDLNESWPDALPDSISTLGRM